MTTPVNMPQFGESIHEGMIGKWLKQPGDRVERFEPLVEAITDKVSAEIPSPVDGVLARVFTPEGQTVEVGTLLAEIETQDSKLTANGKQDTGFMIESTAVFPAGTGAGGWYDDEPEQAQAAVTGEQNQTPGRLGKLHRYSPAVRRLAEEHNLMLDTLPIEGSGIGGRITRNDVLGYLEKQRSTTPDTLNMVIQKGDAATNSPVSSEDKARQEKKEPAISPAFEMKSTFPTNGYVSEAGEIVPLTPMRKTIAEHMAYSKQTIPHAWTMVEVDMTRLVKYRAAIKEEFRQREGVELTFLPFMIKAVLDGLKQYPALNSGWSQDGSGIVQKRNLNIGVAVDIPDGLIVPVIHQADEKSLVGLARSLSDLVNRARTKKLTPAEVQGGTFTVNNPGSFGSVLSYPIINRGQAAILTMEAIIKRPVVVTGTDGEDTIAIRSLMNMCLSFDHRIIDGAIAGRFLHSVKKWLEGYEGRGW